MEELKFTVYKITCVVTNKMYIGYTSLTVISRFKKHATNAFDKTIKPTKFYNAIKKYGIHSFNIEVLEENLNTREKATELEKYYISLYDTFKTGYNSTIGGDGGAICKELSEEQQKQWIEKISLATTKDNNPRWCGKSDDELVEIAVQYAIDNGNIFLQRRWKKYAKECGLPQTFSKNRFGGVFENFKQLVIKLAKQKNIEIYTTYIKTEEHKQKLSKANIGKIKVILDDGTFTYKIKE